MKIDTKIRHVTNADANIFLELGFGQEEAEHLHAIAQKQIDDAYALTEQLMTELASQYT